MTQPYRQQSKISQRICWMTDLHLDQSDTAATNKLLHQLEITDYEIALITGDIASSRHLNEHLAILAKACAGRPLYITTGNHDYYGSSIEDTQEQISRLCRQIPNLQHLSARAAIPLGDQAILVGADGWADNQWRGERTEDVHSPDHHSIADFRRLHPWGRSRLMRKLGALSTDAVRARLKPKLRRAKKVYVATHVPPFFSSALYNGRPCDANHQPHYVHASLGGMLIGMARDHGHTEFLSISGHTHSQCLDHIFPNLTSIVGGHRKNHPKIQQILAA